MGIGPDGSKDPPLLLVGNREPLAALGAAALYNLPAVLGCHTNQEAMRFRAAPGIWLKRTLALFRSRHILLGRTCDYVPLTHPLYRPFDMLELASLGCRLWKISTPVEKLVEKPEAP